jgi:HK97 family phage major capsid protein
VKPEYRKNGVWMMNDETALALRTIKDTDGNYIWNHTNDTILGKRVCISEHMPGAESGSKPIAFGDFSYYWIVCRRPVSVRTLVEQFVMMDCIGYLAYEFLDGKLVRPEAIKVLQMTA